MSLPIYQRVAVTDAGDVIPGAEYTVINENTGVAAPIYSDRTGATLLTAPYFADSVGTIQFFIAQGTTFRVAASGGVGTYTDRYIYAAHPQASATDTTAGSLMAVGAFGLGTSTGPSITNLDTITVSGFYAYTNGATGAPIGDVGTVFHQAGVSAVSGSLRWTQFAISKSSGKSYTRTNDGGTILPWNEIITANAAGNVGIGTSTPSAALDVIGVAEFGDGTRGVKLSYSAGNNSGVIDTANTGDTLEFRIANSEKARLDSSGNLLVGTASVVSAGVDGIQLHQAIGQISTGRSSTGGANHHAFYNPNGLVGTISTSGSATSYNTSSDYRLKEDDVPMTGATERVKALRPVNFAWKADGSRVDGFFAHELAEVVPEAASGTKDAMMDEEYEITPAVYEDVTTPAVEAVLDEDGMVITEAVEESTESVLVTEAVMATRSVPDYQGIDQSKLVPLLTATIQELIARIEALEAGA